MVPRIVQRPYVYTREGKAAMRDAAKKAKGPRAPRVRLRCEGCGKFYARIASDYSRRPGRFCSIACIGLGQRGESNPSWRGGYRPYYGRDWRRIRRAARARDGNRCARCGVRGRRRKLDVHHIRPVSAYREANNANRLDNVVTLCHRCHMQVEGKPFKA